MYLREFSIGNFKAFGETQRLPIKPLTLIYGPNSGGKSSLIHGLLLAAQSITSEESSIDVHGLGIAGGSVDLGGFRQFVFRQDTTLPVEFGFKLDPRDLVTDGILTGAREVSVATSVVQEHVEKARGDALTARGAPHALRTDVRVDGRTLLRMRWSPADSHMRVDALDYNHPALAEMVSTLGANVGGEAKLRQLFDKFIPEVRLSGSRLLPSELTIVSPSDAQSMEQLHAALTRARAAAGPLVRDGKASEQYSGIVFEEFKRRIDGICGLVDLDFGTIVYLGPLRAYPPRDLPESMQQDVNYRSGGAIVWDLLRDNGSLREDINEWLGAKFLKTPYRLELRKLYDPEQIKLAHLSGVLPKARGIGRLVDRLVAPAAPSGSELAFVDLRTGARVSHRDIGVGISQVLPVLVLASVAIDGIVVIEQPEIHIHPALQSELADAFIEAALGHNSTFVIETHSEHLILRILRRIRETAEMGKKLPKGRTAIRPEDVCVVYVEPTSKGSVVHHIPVTEDGEFAKRWPGGFFAERAAELF